MQAKYSSVNFFKVLAVSVRKQLGEHMLLLNEGIEHYNNNVFSGQTPLHPFAFRTHTHGMGRVVSAFFKNPVNGWTMIGKRNPQWPQLFQPITTNLTISNGDLMAATCVYDSLMQKKTMLMG